MNPGDEVAGRYRLEELHGRGPMSEVWRAHDLTLDRTVAVKMLSPTADLDRFRREAQAIAALAHQNVMQVFDYGEDEAGPFMALEWLPKGTLEDRLARGALPPEETRRVAEGIAAGLAHLHSRGLVHRDLKPANVLFDEEERPKLGDFGLARRVVGAGTLTDAGTVLGTAAYISPEQAGGEPAGPASDVYSFGVILFRMLTGALPFAADDAIALLDMHRRTPPPAVETLQPDAPPELAALTAAALRKDPAARPADGEALLAALGGTAATTVVGAADAAPTQVLTPTPAAAPPPHGGRFSRRTALIALGLLVLALAGGLLAWAVTRPSSTAPAGVTTGSVPSTTKTHPSTATSTSPPTTQTSRPTTTQRQTTAPTTTATPTTTTQVPSTTIPTTVPTDTLPTTVLPTTTVGTTGITATVGQTSTPTSTQSTTTAVAAR